MATPKQVAFLKSLAKKSPGSWQQLAGVATNLPLDANQLTQYSCTAGEASKYIDALKNAGVWTPSMHGPPATTKQIGFALGLALQAGPAWKTKGLAAKYGVPTSATLKKMTTKEISALIDDLKAATGLASYEH